MSAATEDETDAAVPADWAFGSFTEHAPWVLDPDHLDWTPGIGVLRSATQRQVPSLTTPRKIPPIGRQGVVVFQIARALLPWAAFDRRSGGSTSRAGLSRRLREAVERLGPTYIKLGQIVSSGEGIFPPELVGEFRKCRDRVPAEPFDTVREVVETELGGPIEATFSEFDPDPIAAASIAQVHRARLVTGEEVVVKVQRPTIRQQVERDLRVMAWLAPLLVGRIPIAALANPPALVELFAETICEELDFRLEAQNMLDVAKVFAEVGQRGYVVPRPHPTLVTRRLLVMERFVGFAFDEVEAMHGAGIDTEQVVRIGMQGFTEGALIYGIFHGDLHGGNLLVLPDGRIGLLDFGITARMTALQRSAFLRLMMTGATGDVKGQLAAFRDLGALPIDTDIDEVYRDLGLDQEQIDPTAMTQDQLVGEIQRVIKLLLGYGARLPKILMLYVKNLMFLDGAIARLAPDLDMLSEFSDLSVHMATNFADHIAADMGVDAAELTVDPDAIKASFGIHDPDVTQLTYADLQARRDTIRRRLSGK